MSRMPQTVRSQRTRAALRRAAMQRFAEQGVEATTAEQIAADAGVTLRTFYRHFPSKHDLLFADYDSGLQWFRKALIARPADEPLLDSVREAIFTFPYDVQALTQMAAFRAEQLDPERIASHLQLVEADFADAITEHLNRRSAQRDARNTDVLNTDALNTDALNTVVTARVVAAAVFGALEVWMRQDDRTLPGLSAMSNAALDVLSSLTKP